MTAVFALVAGLTWNEAIKTVITQFLKSSEEVIGFLIYAIVVTIITVIITVFLGQTLSKAGIEEENEK